MSESCPATDMKKVSIYSILDACPDDYTGIAFAPYLFNHLEEKCDHIDRVNLYLFFRDELWLYYVGMNNVASVSTLITLEILMKRIIESKKEWVSIEIRKENRNVIKKPDELSYKEALTELYNSRLISEDSFKKGRELNDLRNIAVHRSVSRAERLGMVQQHEPDKTEKMKEEIKLQGLTVLSYSLNIIKDLTKDKQFGTPEEAYKFLELLIGEENKIRKALNSQDIYDKLAEENPIFKDGSFKINKYFLTKP